MTKGVVNYQTLIKCSFSMTHVRLMSLMWAKPSYGLYIKLLLKPELIDQICLVWIFGNHKTTMMRLLLKMLASLSSDYMCVIEIILVNTLL